MIHQGSQFLSSNFSCTMSHHSLSCYVTNSTKQLTYIQLLLLVFRGESPDLRPSAPLTGKQYGKMEPKYPGGGPCQSDLRPHGVLTSPFILNNSVETTFNVVNHARCLTARLPPDLTTYIQSNTTNLYIHLCCQFSKISLCNGQPAVVMRRL